MASRYKLRPLLNPSPDMSAAPRRRSAVDTPPNAGKPGPLPTGRLSVSACYFSTPPQPACTPYRASRRRADAACRRWRCLDRYPCCARYCHSSSAAGCRDRRGRFIGAGRRPRRGMRGGKHWRCRWAARKAGVFSSAVHLTLAGSSWRRQAPRVVRAGTEELPAASSDVREWRATVTGYVAPPPRVNTAV